MHSHEKYIIYPFVNGIYFVTTVEAECVNSTAQQLLQSKDHRWGRIRWSEPFRNQAPRVVERPAPDIVCSSCDKSMEICFGLPKTLSLDCREILEDGTLAAYFRVLGFDTTDADRRWAHKGAFRITQPNMPQSCHACEWSFSQSSIRLVDVLESNSAPVQDMFFGLLDSDDSDSISMQACRVLVCISGGRIFGEGSLYERWNRLENQNASWALQCQEFLDGCTRLKGFARSMDVHAVLADARRNFSTYSTNTIPIQGFKMIFQSVKTLAGEARACSLRKRCGALICFGRLLYTFAAGQCSALVSGSEECRRIRRMLLVHESRKANTKSTYNCI